MSISDLLFTSNARKQNLREGYSNVGKQVEEPMIMKNQSLKDWKYSMNRLNLLSNITKRVEN